MNVERYSGGRVLVRLTEQEESALSSQLGAVVDDIEFEGLPVPPLLAELRRLLERKPE